MATQLDKATYLQHLRSDGDALIATLAGDHDAAVAGCPGWSVADLVVHMGRVWGYLTDTISAASTEPPSHGFPPKPEEGADLAAWATTYLDGAYAAAEALDPATPLWSFGSDQSGAFYPRRMAHETAVHLWDALDAQGTAHQLDAVLATDGIAEFFDVSVGRMDVARLPASSLHLHRTDGEGEWMVQLVDGALQITEEHAKGDVAVKGSASDLLLYLWGRGRGSSIEIFGDDTAADAWGSLLSS